MNQFLEQNLAMKISMSFLKLPGAPWKILHLWNVCSLQNITLFAAASDLASFKSNQLSDSVLPVITQIKILPILPTRTSDLTSNFEAIWGQYGLCLVVLGYQNDLNFVM